MSFDVAVSGLQAVNEQIDTISNNIANANTYGFKSSRVNFADMYAGEQPTGTKVSSKTQRIGMGGGVVSTGSAMDVAIQGRGFFVSRDQKGAILYSRVGMFSTNKDGFVVDGFGRKAQGYIIAPGTTVPGPLGDLTVPTGQVAAKATTKLQYVGNLSAGWTAPTVAPFNATDPLTFNSSTTSAVYDSLGNQHSLTQYFVKSGVNTVNVYYTFDGAAAGGPQALAFNATGQLPTPTPAVSVAVAPAGAAPLTINIDYTGTSQYAGAATTTTNSADGYASGTLTGLQITEDGAVMAQYSNGQKQSVGLLALASFPDEQALSPVGDSSWTVNTASGAPVYSTAGVGMVGKLATGALEQSNVDVTSELVSLMTSQRNYQANSKVISAQSQMMQSLMQALQSM
ncbi:flagellar hook-basal body complex protein [Herbaspirillum sp. HC18]|nr:flagellar hook-basal body complex protein [Herbaspirillum sp. HC18]